MIALNKNFKDALDAGYLPIIKVYLSSQTSRRVYAKVLPDLDTESGPRYWDGSWDVGEGIFGYEREVTQAGTRVLQFGSQSVNIAPQDKNLLGSYAQTEIGSFQVILDNVDRYFSNILALTSGESFLQQDLEIKAAVYGLAESDEITLFKGTVTQEQIGPKLKLVAEGITPSLYETFELPKTSLYTNPGADNNILPIPYGDLTENTGSQGVLVAHCIDTANDVYALAGCTIQSVGGGNVITLYDDDGEISSSDYAVTTSGDYESVGQPIAYVTFSTPPTGKVTWKGNGRADSSDALITNPIEVLKDVLGLAGDVTQHDLTAFAKAGAQASEYGYTCAGALTSDTSPAYWMTDLLSSFLGSWYLRYDQTLAVTLDTPGGTVSNIAGVLHDQPDGTGIQGFRTRENICNQVIVNYAISWSQIDRRFKNDANTAYFQTDEGEDSIDTASVFRFGERKKTLSFNWTRNTATVNAIQAHLVDTYAYPLYVLTFPEEGFQNFVVEPGDYVLYSWEYLTDDEGYKLKNQIGRVIGIDRDYDNMRITFTLQDTGEYWTITDRYWDGSWQVGEGTFGSAHDRRAL